MSRRPNLILRRGGVVYAPQRIVMQTRRLQVVTDERFALMDAGTAFARLENRHVMGKVVTHP